MNPKPTRQGTVDGKTVLVYDGLVPVELINQIKSALDANGFIRNEIAKPETGDHKHWAREMPLEAAAQLPLFKPTILAAQPFCRAGTRYRLYRAYTNYASFGDMLYTHTDCAPGAGELTALWFIADQWDVEWGGETLFFDQHEDAQFVVSPKPGRLVVFDSEILHAGRPPSRICFAPRYTYAMKMEPVAEVSSGEQP